MKGSVRKREGEWRPEKHPAATVDLVKRAAMRAEKAQNIPNRVDVEGKTIMKGRLDGAEMYFAEEENNSQVLVVELSEKG